MDIKLVSGSYKSISELSWINIPMFSVVTGPNGSGKTHLLELIAKKLGVHIVPEGRENARGGGIQPIDDDAKLHVSIPFSQPNVVFQRSRWMPTDSHANVESVIRVAEEAWNDNRQPNQNRSWDQLWSAISKKTGKDRSRIEKSEFLEVLPPNFILLSDRQKLHPNIAELFISYLHDAEMNRRKGRQQELGPLPWDTLDEIFEKASLPYRVVTPVVPEPQRFSNEPMTYRLMLKDYKTGKLIPPAELSSGERVMFQIAIWLFTFQLTNESAASSDSNKLLLLDEPDAHLHPALSKYFLDAITKLLVETYGIRVIMTTHSPSTVAMTPTGSLFVMDRDGTRIKPVQSKWQAVGLLTAGLVTVGTDSKCVFVEDKDDCDFYNELQNHLKVPTNGRSVLESRPSIVFISAREGHPGKGQGLPSGGKNNVIKWVKTIESTQIAGIIDLDDGNQSSDRIHVIGRYSHENYLLDPLFVYAVLLDKGNPPNISNLNIERRSARQLLTSLSEAKLQAAIDAMLNEFLQLLPNLKSTSANSKCAVNYHNGPELQMPEWFIRCDAKTLLEPLRRRYDVDRKHLINQYALMDIVPQELVTIFRNIQSA